MFRKDIMGLVRRILVLAVLIAGLALASSGWGQSGARAAICCGQCLENFDWCLNGCSDQACVDQCNSTLVSCHRFCDWGC